MIFFQKPASKSVSILHAPPWQYRARPVPLAGENSGPENGRTDRFDWRPSLKTYEESRRPSWRQVLAPRATRHL